MHRRAVAATLAYLALSVAYVAGSTQVAAAWTASEAHFVAIEIWKGLLFVLASGAGLLGLLEAVERRRADADRERERLRRALVVAERRAEAGLQAGAVAHDLRNVLTALTMGVEALRDEGVEPEVADALDEATQRGIALTDRLARIGGLGRRDSSQELVDLPRLLGVFTRDLTRHPHLADRRLDLRIEGRPGPLRASVTAVFQIVSNLVLNAAEATSAGGRVEVRVLSTPDGAAIEVHDDGPGIPLRDRSRVLEPFYTTRPDGTGLGLPSVVRAAAAHGGSVDIACSPLGGACVRVTLPANGLPAEAQRASAAT